jgi:hypothetical protein
VYTLNGVILGASVAITATGDTTTELVTNGDFAVDANWTKGTGWTIAAGVATKVAGSATGLSQTIALVAGRTYAVVFTLVRTAGTFTPKFSGGTLVSSAGITASGTYTVYMTAVTGNVDIAFDTTSTFAGTLDNVSIKSVLLTVDNTSSLYVCGTSAVRSAAQWFSHRLFNRAKTVAENLSMFVNGMAAADVGIFSQVTPNGDFETWSTATNPGTWSEGANVSASVSQVTGGDQYAGTYSMQFSGNGTPSVSFNNTIYQSFFGSVFINKKVRIKIACKRTAGTGNLYIGQGASEFSTISPTSS